MFTIFQQFKAKPAQQAFVARLLHLLNWYQQQTEGQWLRSINIGAIKFCFCQSMTADNGIMGAFSPLRSDTIVLMPCPNLLQQNSDSFGTAILQGWADIIAPTAIHQLRHKWQSMQYGTVKYILCSLPLVRQFTIQSDADKVTIQAQRMLQVKVAADYAGKSYAKQKA